MSIYLRERSSKRRPGLTNGTGQADGQGGRHRAAEGARVSQHNVGWMLSYGPRLTSLFKQVRLSMLASYDKVQSGRTTRPRQQGRAIVH